MKLLIAGICTSLLGLLFTSVTTAQQKSYPSISGAIPLEIENDWAYRSDDRAN